MKELYFDEMREDIHAVVEVSDEVLHAPAHKYKWYRAQKVAAVFQHGERTRAFFQKESMRDVLDMFQDLPFAALNPMVQEYLLGVYEIRIVDLKREESQSQSKTAVA